MKKSHPDVEKSKKYVKKSPGCEKNQKIMWKNQLDVKKIKKICGKINLWM